MCYENEDIAKTRYGGGTFGDVMNNAAKLFENIKFVGNKIANYDLSLSQMMPGQKSSSPDEDMPESKAEPDAVTTEDPNKYSGKATKDAALDPSMLRIDKKKGKGEQVVKTLVDKPREGKGLKLKIKKQKPIPQKPKK